jgi:hypothetical protein
MSIQTYICQNVVNSETPYSFQTEGWNEIHSYKSFLNRDIFNLRAIRIATFFATLI